MFRPGNRVEQNPAHLAPSRRTLPIRPAQPPGRAEHALYSRVMREFQVQVRKISPPRRAGDQGDSAATSAGATSAGSSSSGRSSPIAIERSPTRDSEVRGGGGRGEGTGLASGNGASGSSGANMVNKNNYEQLLVTPEKKQAATNGAYSNDPSTRYSSDATSPSSSSRNPTAASSTASTSASKTVSAPQIEVETGHAISPGEVKRSSATSNQVQRMEPRKMSPRGQMLWETSMFRAVDEEDEDTILETLLEWEILSGRPVDADPTSVDFQVVGAGSDHGLDLEGALEEKGEEREEESAEEGQSEHGRVDEKDDDGEQEPGETEEEPSSQEPQSQSNQDTTNCTTLPSSTSTTSLWTQLNAERRAKALARARERYGDTLDKPLHVFELNGDEHLLTHLREWHTVWDLKRCMMRKLDAYVTKPVICRGNYIYDDRDYLADVQRDKTDRQAERRRSVVLAGGSRSEGSSGASAGQGQGPQASRPSAPAGPAARSEGSSTGAISSLSSTQQQQEPSASSTSQTPTERNSSYSNNVEDLSPSEDDEDDQDLYYVAGRRFHPAFPDMEVHVDLQQLQLQREKVMQGRARRSSCRGKSASYSIFNPLN